MSTLKRKTALKRKKRIRTRSPDYDPVKRNGPPGFMDYIHSLPCCVPRCLVSYGVEAAHVPHLSQGGLWPDILPLCHADHRTGKMAHHAIGTARFVAEVLGAQAEKIRARVAQGWIAWQAHR